MKSSISALKNNMNKYLKSIKVLHLVFILSALYLGKLVLYRRDELLVLFIAISAVVYLLNKNMILVLLMPLVFVMFVDVMRQCCFHQVEGFVDSELNEIDLAMKEIQKLLDKGDYDDYMLYDDLAELIDELKDNYDTMKSKDKKKLYLKMKKYFESMAENDDASKAEEKEFAMKLGTAITTILESSNTEEEETAEDEESEDE